jgi:hypothetical protein
MHMIENAFEVAKRSDQQKGLEDYDRRPRRSPSIAAGHFDRSCRWFNTRAYYRKYLSQPDQVGGVICRRNNLVVVDPVFWTRKRPFLRWRAALKIEESQCPKPARVTHPA